MPTWTTTAAGGGGTGGGMVVLAWVNAGAGTTTVVPCFTSTTSTTSSTICITNLQPGTCVSISVGHPAFTTDATYHHLLGLQQQAMQMMLAQGAAAQGAAAQGGAQAYVNGLGGAAGGIGGNGIGGGAARAPTEAELAAERERHRRYEEEAARRQQARERAKELLLEHLTDEQRETVERNGWFIVEGGKSKRRYRIKTNSGASGNVERLDCHGRSDERLCGHYRGSAPIPDYDQFLAQKLMLEGDEDAYRALANRSAVL